MLPLLITQQDFHCFKRNKYWSLCHFVCKFCSSTSWKSKHKFYFDFFLTTGIFKKLLSITRNKKKHDKILILAKSKLDSIETLVSQALIDMEISHEEFNAIIREEEKYERMKENMRNVSECSSAKKQENIRLNSVNSRKITSL